MGLHAVDKIAEDLGLDGVHGPLYRLFEVTDQKFNIAVELTAGTRYVHLCFYTARRLKPNSLFHVVVDTDDIASQVLDVMLREKTGRVTFMPLNRLHPQQPNLPVSQDAIPLIEKLRFDPMHRSAFQQVFGKTCVCRDLTTATAYVRSHGVNTITLDGDKVDRKGALTGGYHDVRRSRIDAIKNVAMWRLKLTSESKKSQEVKSAITDLEQQITNATSQISSVAFDQNRIRASRDSMLEEGNILVKEKEQLKNRISKLEIDASELEMELDNLQTRLADYRAELSAPMAKEPVDQDEKISSLGKDVEKRQTDLIHLRQTKNEVNDCLGIAPRAL